MVFSLSALWWRMIRGLWELPDRRDWLRGKLGLVLICRAIQFSVVGWGCVPSLLSPWSQTMVEVMKIMVTSSKGPMHTLLHSVPPTLQQAPIHSRLCPRLLDTRGKVWVSLLWGHCSFLLDPDAHRVLFVPSKSLFPQSCVSSGGSVVGLMVTSSKRAYAIHRSTAPRAPSPMAGHCWPGSPSVWDRHGLSQSLWVLWVLALTRFVWALWASLEGMGFDSEHDFTTPTILLGLLCPWTWGISSQPLLCLLSWENIMRS